VVITGAQPGANIMRWGAVSEDIVCRLKVERLLDLSVGSYKEVDENKEGNKERKKEIYTHISIDSMQIYAKLIDSQYPLTKKLHHALVSPYWHWHCPCTTNTPKIQK
jgi:hypothetical protein